MRPIQHINAYGVALIKTHEGFRGEAYLCPANIWTIGYGHTRDVQAGDTMTLLQAEDMLRRDVAVFENGVNRMVAVELTSNQFSALVCFTFNVGLQAFYRSTLLSLLNRGWYSQVPPQLKKWTRAGGVELAGLVGRRRDEAALWLREG